MKILFIGDIVGKLGRDIVKEMIPIYVKKYGIDFVIANGENASHGKGLTRSNYDELIDAGVDAITLGNHYKNKIEITHYIDEVDRLVRPLNLVEDFPGVGSIVFDVEGVSIRVTNILGQAFMHDQVQVPYFSLLSLLENPDEEKADIHIVDYHAEATGEKQGFAYALDGLVSAVLCTHTHVQTNDAKILPNGTGFISDVGMCGFKDGVLGFEKDSVIKKTVFNENSRFEIPDEGLRQFNAVVIDVDPKSGLTTEIFPINYIEK